MAMERYNLTLPVGTELDPVLKTMATRFGVTSRVVQTSVADDARWYQVTFTADADNIGRAMAYLQTTGVIISPPHLAFNR